MRICIRLPNRAIELTSAASSSSTSPALCSPFRGYPQQNPSTLTARHLANLVLHSPPSPAHAKGRRIEITFLPVSVNYSAVDEVIPPFHKEQRYDAYVHVGVASRAKDGLRIEQRGRKGEYNSPDSEGLYCPRDAEGRRTVPGWKGDKEEILSRLDTEGLLHWLKKDKGIQVRVHIPS